MCRTCHNNHNSNITAKTKEIHPGAFVSFFEHCGRSYHSIKGLVIIHRKTSSFSLRYIKMFFLLLVKLIDDLVLAPGGHGRDDLARWSSDGERTCRVCEY